MKKGFTLVEILGAIVILSLILLIATSAVNAIISNQKAKLYEEQVSLILTEAKEWATLNHTELVRGKGINFVELSTLVSEGVIENEAINDPRDGSKMNGCIVITYNTEYSQYQYSYSDSTCSEEQSKYGPLWTNNIEGASDDKNNPEEVEVGSKYTYPVVTAVSTATNNRLDVVGPTVRVENKTQDIVDTSYLGRVYSLTYSAHDDSYKYTFSKTYYVKIVDTNAPEVSLDQTNLTGTERVFGDKNIVYVVKDTTKTNYATKNIIVKDNSCFDGITEDARENNACGALFAQQTDLSVRTPSTISIATIGTQEVKYKVFDKTKNKRDYTLKYQVINADFYNPTYNIPTGWALSKTVTIKYPEIAGVSYEYSTDGNTWTRSSSSTQTVKFIANGTIYARVVYDGQVVGSSSANVDYIDNTAPTITKVTPSSTDVVNSLTFTVEATDPVGPGLHQEAYSFDNGATWQASNKKTYTSETTFNVKVRDAVGNISAAKTVTVEPATLYCYKDATSYSSSWSTTKPTYYKSRTEYRYKSKDTDTETAECEHSNSGTYWGDSSGNGGCAKGQKNICGHTCDKDCWTSCAEGICTQPGASGSWRLHYYCTYSTTKCGGWSSWSTTKKDEGCGTDKRTTYAAVTGWSETKECRSTGAYDATPTRQPVNIVGIKSAGA